MTARSRLTAPALLLLCLAALAGGAAAVRPLAEVQAQAAAEALQLESRGKHSGDKGGEQKLNLRPLIGIVSQVGGVLGRSCQVALLQAHSTCARLRQPSAVPGRAAEAAPAAAAGCAFNAAPASAHPTTLPTFSPAAAGRPCTQGTLIHCVFVREAGGERGGTGGAHSVRHVQGGGGAAVQGGIRICICRVSMWCCEAD